jgi:GxxExxY protein
MGKVGSMVEEPFVDHVDEPDPELNRITNAIIGAGIEVHRQLGCGYVEAYYERALERELKLRGIAYSRQHRFEVNYKGEVIGTGEVDFVVEGKVIVEIKAVEKLAPVHVAQVISYLRALGLRLGLLINFNTDLLKNGIKRIAR